MKTVDEEKLKLSIAQHWLKGEISETTIKKVLHEEEIKDLKFGKRWIKETLE